MLCRIALLRWKSLCSRPFGMKSPHQSKCGHASCPKWWTCNPALVEKQGSHDEGRWPGSCWCAEPVPILQSYTLITARGPHAPSGMTAPLSRWAGALLTSQDTACSRQLLLAVAAGRWSSLAREQESLPGNHILCTLLLLVGVGCPLPPGPRRGGARPPEEEPKAAVPGAGPAVPPWGSLTREQRAGDSRGAATLPGSPGYQQRPAARTRRAQRVDSTGCWQRCKNAAAAAGETDQASLLQHQGATVRRAVLWQPPCSCTLDA